LRHRRFLSALAVAAASVLVVPVADATTGSLSISSVGGQAVRRGRIANPVSGVVEVRGTASVSDGTATPPTPPPLVADAGDSAFVGAGQRATLVGMAFGGTSPYSFAWTTPAGTIVEGADAATALLDTTGVAPGTYTLGFTVSDATGASASDTVAVVVAEITESTAVDEERVDTTPGVLSNGSPGTLDFPFTVEPGTTRIEAAATWTVPANDYDLALIDPSGAERVLVGDPAGVTTEATGLSDPEPGTWIAQLQKFSTVVDTVHMLVTATSTGPDPRPAVDAGGPYKFRTGAQQALDGTVTGGTAPTTTAWDLDGDGRFETAGTDVRSALPAGRHLVTLKATDGAGLERRQTTSVLVADPARLAAETTPITVIGIADTGINPYHLEFSATTYPDPDVLALTDNFTRHPSEYIPGYPADAEALDVTLGEGYFPAADTDVWTPENIHEGELYWIPGTKIVGAWDAGDAASLQESTVDGNPDSHPILDDNGHGSGSASVSTGNRYGYCPTCLLMMVESLDETVATAMSWVDITSHSFGYVGGAPLGPVLGPNEATKAAVERGQTVLFAAGNGIGNAFDVPISTYGSDQTGNDWNITVGALRRDNQRAVVGDGIPVHMSAWGDGNLPSACRTGTVGQCAFGGTSAATPYTAGIFGTVLTEVRDAIGDAEAGQRTPVTLADGTTQGQVVAEGFPVADSAFLADGLLTRAELREAVLKTAFPLTGETSPYPYPLTAPYNDSTNVLFEGYGAATTEGARRAVDVLLGRSLLPDRSYEDEFFAIDAAVRDALYGSYDRDGDGDDDPAADPTTDAGIDGLGLGAADLMTVEGAMAALSEAASVRQAAANQAAVGTAGTAAAGDELVYHLHRRVAAEPDEATPVCDAEKNEQYMDRADTEGDLEPCFENRVTTVAAAFRPVGIFASTDTLDAPVPAGSLVTADVYLAGETPAAVRPTAVLVATDREIGEAPGTFQPVLGSGPGGAACATLAEACWTHYTIQLRTTRPAFTGEQLTFQVQLFGTRSWAFGHEGAHASKVTITPAAVPATGFEFGATVTSPAAGEVVEGGTTLVAGGSYSFPDQGTDPTGAGDHTVQRRVQVSIDDATFRRPIEATLDDGAWSAPLGQPAAGRHTVYVRARQDRTYSAVRSAAFTVRPATRVEWQVVDRNVATDPAAWRDATGLSSWTFSFDTRSYGTGGHTIVTRLVSAGAVLAERTVVARFTR
jgi:Subtilase family